MNGMVCRSCGARFYSAAAAVLVERGDTCSTCGGELELRELSFVPDLERAEIRARVGGEGDGEDAPPEPRRRRRFGRD